MDSINTSDQETTCDWFGSDSQFNQLYPLSIQQLAKKHWTPLNIVEMASRYLAVEANENILDIGSGVGKFCLGAAHFRPWGNYCGVEQRKSLITHAEKAKDILRLENVQFIHGNFTQLDFKKYDQFYFYNSFYENLEGTEKIDNNLDYSLALFNYYNHYLFQLLLQKPKGTRLCTLCSWGDELPADYHLVHSSFDELLKCWIRV